MEIPLQNLIPEVEGCAPAAPPRSLVSSALKQALDFCGGLLLLLCVIPLLLLIALTIKLQDGGPVFYRRRVVGRRGEFDAFKFRTMRCDADAFLAGDVQLKRAFEQDFKLKSDPRVTRIGSFLRKFSLDELPQLFNVLKGEMSLVGPRMITSAELAKYGPYGQLLRSVRPGMTGYWQIKARHRVSYEERVRMDVYYILNWSLLLDLEILLKTPWRVLKGEGAY